MMENSILIISFWNPISQNPKKGVFIQEQVKAIYSLRKDITFLEVNVLPSKKAIFETTFLKKESSPYPVITINIYSILWKFILVSPWLLCFIIKNNLTKNLNDFRPLLIHSNVIFPCGIVGHLLARRYHVKHVISEHWSMVEKYAKHPIFGKQLLNAYRNSVAIMCVSNFLADKIKRLAKKENVYVVPNVIDQTTFKYEPKIDLPNSPLNFLCIAAWEKPKRLDLIINSLHNFSLGSQKNIVLNVVGDGRQKEEFINKTWPSNFIINWLGFLEKDEIVKLLYKTHVFLHASEIETFSIVTAEALSTGTPVLASNTGALPDLINPSNGILVNNNIDSWIKGLYEITEKTYNNQAIAFEVSNKYSPESVGHSIEKVYESILNNQ